MEISRLIEICDTLGFKDVASSLRVIDSRMNDHSCPIILPLVGEFSAGKTSLINALTDAKKLETSTKPTTSTIYEIHFGCERSYATVKTENGDFQEIDDLASLKNSELTNADFVKVYDTSSRIAPTTLLIDTPGLSSSDPRHRQALVSFLPEADGILLVMDINAQLSRSTIDFVNTMSLSGRPIYLIMTYCDTKTPEDAQRTINNIKTDHQLPFKRITSSKSGYLDEMYDLLGEIQRDKSAILEKVYSSRVKRITDDILQRIDELLSSSQDDNALQESISKQKLELRKVQDKLDRIFESAKAEIDESKRKVCREFEDSVFGKLDALVAGKSANFDAEAMSIVNNTSSLSLNNFKNAVRKLISEASSQGEKANITLASLAELDMSEYSIDGLSYNLNLNEVGHEYDKRIASGLKIAAAVGAVVATAGAASGATGAAAAEGAAGTATMLQTVDTVTDIADTVSDVSSIVSNKNSVQKIQGLISQTQGEFDNIETTQQGIGQRFGSDKGIIDSMVGFVTDSAWGKPQRRRAIHEYVDGNLMPSFKSELSRISSELESRIKQVILADAAIYTQEMTSALEALLQSQREKKEEFQTFISSLRDYKQEILTNK